MIPRAVIALGASDRRPAPCAVVLSPPIISTAFNPKQPKAATGVSHPGCGAKTKVPMQMNQSCPVNANNATHQSDTSGNPLSNGQLAQYNDDPAALLTMKEIAERLGISYERLRGFTDEASVREAVGAVNVKGVKGYRYPLEALDLFALVIRAQDEKLITPRTAGAWLKITQREESSAAIVVSSPLPNERNGIEPLLPTLPVIPPDQAKAFADLLRDAWIAAQDNLLTLKQAKEEFPALTIDTIRRLRVQEGKRWFVKRSALLRYIARL